MFFYSRNVADGIPVFHSFSSIFSFCHRFHWLAQHFTHPINSWDLATRQHHSVTSISQVRIQVIDFAGLLSSWGRTNKQTEPVRHVDHNHSLRVVFVHSWCSVWHMKVDLWAADDVYNRVIIFTAFVYKFVKLCLFKTCVIVSLLVFLALSDIFFFSRHVGRSREIKDERRTQTPTIGIMTKTMKIGLISCDKQEWFDLACDFDNPIHTHRSAKAHCEETWEEFSSGLTMFLCPHLAINTVLWVDSHTLSSS